VGTSSESIVDSATALCGSIIAAGSWRNSIVFGRNDARTAANGRSLPLIHARLWLEAPHPMHRRSSIADSRCSTEQLSHIIDIIKDYSYQLAASVHFSTPE
jgi:hypothetical protein